MLFFRYLNPFFYIRQMFRVNNNLVNAIHLCNLCALTYLLVVCFFPLFWSKALTQLDDNICCICNFFKIFFILSFQCIFYSNKPIIKKRIVLYTSYNMKCFLPLFNYANNRKILFHCYWGKSKFHFIFCFRIEFFLILPIDPKLNQIHNFFFESWREFVFFVSYVSALTFFPIVHIEIYYKYGGKQSIAKFSFELHFRVSHIQREKWILIYLRYKSIRHVESAYSTVSFSLKLYFSNIIEVNKIEKEMKRFESYSIHTI